MWYGFLGLTSGGACCVVWLSGSDFRRSRLCGMASWVRLYEHAVWYGFLGQTLGGAGCVVWLLGSDFRMRRLCGMASSVRL